MILKGNPVVRCNRCGTETEIPKNMFDEDVYPIGESGMGVQTQHDYLFEGTCPGCGSEFYIKLIGYEYPVGALDGRSEEHQGCTIVYAPPMEMDYYDFDIPPQYEDWIADDVSELIDQIKYNRDIAYRISARKFEELVAEIFLRNGYSVELTPAVHDGGKDVIATKNVNGIPICLYVECKHYDPNDPVGVSIVREASAVRNQDRVNKAVIVTTSRFTRGAKQFASNERHLIQLMDFDELMRMIT